MRRMKQEERILRQVKTSLKEEYGDDIKVAQEFKVFIEMWKSGVPLKYWEYNAEDIDHETARAAVNKYVDKMDQCVMKGIGLYLWGPQGSGKTLAACVILKEAIKQGYQVQFTMLTEILERYCNTMYDEVGRHDFRNRILDADILVIDDIDKIHISKNSNFADAAYDYLFRTRANKKLPIIVTSNLRSDRFAEQEGMSFGDSLLSLFKEHLYNVKVRSEDKRIDIQKRLGEFFNE